MLGKSTPTAAITFYQFYAHFINTWFFLPDTNFLPEALYLLDPAWTLALTPFCLLIGTAPAHLWSLHVSLLFLHLIFHPYAIFTGLKVTILCEVLNNLKLYKTTEIKLFCNVLGYLYLES